MRKYHNFFCFFYSCDFSFRNNSAIKKKWISKQKKKYVDDITSTIMENTSESHYGEFINFEIIEQSMIYY